MKVSKTWLKELVDLKVPMKEVERLLPLRTIATKEITDDFIELDMKGYNRADLLSMRGVAREVAAITDSKSSEVADNEYIWVLESLPKIDVNVEDEDLTPLYCIAKIEGLKVAKSSDHWIKKLNDSGMRSINNIADITNLIMLEYGQPLHAFDGSVIKGTIGVRNAKAGEEIKTLDGKLRRLETGDLVISDDKKALGIAGVMGGKDSEISESTTTILLEAAIFDPQTIRRTAQRLNLVSDAGKRFYHGLTMKRLLQALNAAIKMYQSLGGKLTALTIKGDDREITRKIPLTLKKVISLIGVDFTAKEVEQYLIRLGFQLDLQLNPKSLIAWVVTPPYYRLDIEIEEDLIEEIARMYGYERIPAKELKGELPEKIDQSLFEGIYNIKKSLAASGLTEVQTYSFYSTTTLKALGFNESHQDAILKVANPISAETEYLREFIWPNLVEVVDKNIKQGFEDIAIFEIGKVYSPTKDGLPKEGYRLAIALMNGSDNPIEELIALFTTVSNVIASAAKPASTSLPLRPIEDLLRKASEASQRGEQSSSELDPTKIATSPTAPRNDSITLEKGGLMKELEALFHPTRFATVKAGDSPRFAPASTSQRLGEGEEGKVIGGVAEVHPRFLNQYGIQKRVAILEISIELI